MHKFASNIQKLIFSYLLTFDSWSFYEILSELLIYYYIILSITLCQSTKREKSNVILQSAYFSLFTHNLVLLYLIFVHVDLYPHQESL